LEEHYLDLPSKASTKSQGLTLPSWVKDYQGKMKAYFPEEKKKENQRSYTALELANRSFDLLQDRYCQMLLENYPVDAQIKIARKQCGTLEFHRAAELIEVGRIKTAAALDRMEHGN
jgi:NTE family protein